MICVNCATAAKLFKEAQGVSNSTLRSKMLPTIWEAQDMCRGGTWCDSQHNKMTGPDAGTEVQALISQAIMVHDFIMRGDFIVY